MGDWSDYFEDFPEENEANYIGGRYYAPDSQEANDLAHSRRFAKVNAEKVAKEQAALDAEISAIIKKHKKP
ncbi:hypothetical protein [Pectobacterium polaris]|uniref:hypothetical protein n=1 Tax=Pectobacterium polaris TaxID=2042057 RepID=UPI001CC6602F|nr:hypothetical protein [Pectobacterium polaris]UAY91182.1 hypothetical protein KSL88_16985 [Pectobacterium polaris]